MQFSFTEEQLAIRAQVRAFLADQCPPSAVRSAWHEQRGWSAARWEALAAMGVVGMLAPARHGGLELGLVDLVGVLEELGWAAAPEPVVESAALAVPALAGLAAGGDEVAEGALAEVTAGRAVATVALAGGPRPGSAGPVGGRRLLHLVPASAEVVVTVEPGAVAVVRLPAPAATVQPRQALDGTRRPAVLELDRNAWQPTVTDRAAQVLVDALADRAATAVAAVLVGLADRMLAMAVQHATDRRQFGRPVGSFQAVAHRLADVAVALASTRPAVYRAAWSVDVEAASRRRDASMAKALASDAATQAARAALQVHGAMGYTWEHDLHLWMKRAWALAAAWGDARQHRAQVLAAVQAGARSGA